MSSDINDLVNFNPRYKLEKNSDAIFVNMAAISENYKFITAFESKKFIGGGSRFQNGDTLFARITPCLENGKTAFVESLPLNQIAYGSTEFIVMSAKNIEDQQYIYYLARLEEFRNYAKSRMEGTSGRQRVSWQSLSEFKFNFPSLTIRKKASSFLSLLDRKIEKNNQINETLEAMAQAIFKSWFVDFDPVHAKVAAKEAGLDLEAINLAAMAVISAKTPAELLSMKAESPADYETLKTTASHFPDSFEDSELGMIPKGWEVSVLKGLCEKVESGGTPKRSEESYWNGDIAWLSSGETHNTIVTETKEKITEIGVKNSSAKLWKPNTTIVAMYGATAGKVCFSSLLLTANQACCALIPKEGYEYFLFLTARNLMSSLAGRASGSAQQNLNKSLVENHECLLPKEEILLFFNELVAINFSQWIGNIQQNKNLTELRDSLLPKLLSGEIEV